MIAEDGWGEAIPILDLTGAVGFASLNPPDMVLRDPPGCVTTRRANHFGFTEVKVKPRHQKDFCFSEMESGLYQWPSRPIQRGVAQRHQRGAGMRWTRTALLTRALEADGEIVWS